MAPPRNNRVLFVTRYSPVMASSRYRVFQYLEPLRQQGYEVRVLHRFEDDSPSSRERSWRSETRFWAQVFFEAGQAACTFVHKHVPSFFPIAWSLRRRTHRLALDFDDAPYALSDGRMLSARSFHLWSLRYLLRHAGMAIAVSPALQEYVSRYCSKVRLIPTVLDVDLYRAKTANAREQQKRPFVIGWIGSSGGDRFLGMLAGVFDDLHERYGERVKLLVVSGSPVAVKTRMAVEQIVWQLDKEHDYFGMIDVGIMPLPDNPRTQAKGGFKLIQYLAAGVPGVASPVGVNTKIVEHGVTGFLADTEKQWRDALCQLVEDHALRDRLSAQGRALVEKEYDISVGTKLLIDALEGVGCYAEDRL